MDVPVVPGSPKASASGLTGLSDRSKPTRARNPINRPSAAVSLSERGKRAQAQKAILEEVLGSINERFSGDELFDEAGRADYLSSIADPTDLSSAATAKRILGGITGYIYGGFKLANEELGLEEFEAFKSQVLDGFERGMAEAGRVLGALSVLDPELASDIAETERLVREGLDEFFAREEERVRGAQAA